MLFCIHIHSPLRFIKNIHRQSCSFMCQPSQQCGMEISWSPGLKKLCSSGSHPGSGNFYLYNFTPLSHLAFAVGSKITGLQNSKHKTFIQIPSYAWIMLSLSHTIYQTILCSLCWVFVRVCGFCLLSRLKNLLLFPINISSKVSEPRLWQFHFYSYSS